MYHLPCYEVKGLLRDKSYINLRLYIHHKYHLYIICSWVLRIDHILLLTVSTDYTHMDMSNT